MLILIYIYTMSKELRYQLAVKRKNEIVNMYGGKRLAEILGISHPAVSKLELISPFIAYQIALIGDFDMAYIRPDLDFSINI